MTSIINQYRDTENAIKELQARMEALKNDARLQVELEFEGKLRALMGEYSKSLRDVLSILDTEHKVPKAAKPTSGTPKVPGAPRALRKIKQYRNPHNGEVIETKGGNHKALLEWKAKWGAETVESWMTLLD